MTPQTSARKHRKTKRFSGKDDSSLERNDYEERAQTLPGTANEDVILNDRRRKRAKFGNEDLLQIIHMQAQQIEQMIAS